METSSDKINRNIIINCTVLRIKKLQAVVYLIGSIRSKVSNIGKNRVLSCLLAGFLRPWHLKENAFQNKVVTLVKKRMAT